MLLANQNIEVCHQEYEKAKIKYRRVMGEGLRYTCAR